MKKWIIEKTDKFGNVSFFGNHGNKANWKFSPFQDDVLEFDKKKYALIVKDIFELFFNQYQSLCPYNIIIKCIERKGEK